MSALTALVIEVEALHPGTLDSATGQAVQGLWLNHWKRLHPELSQPLHDQYPVKPYTVSPLMGLPLPVRGRVAIQRGDRAWFRVVSLDSLLSEKLVEEWLPLLPSPIKIAGLEWKIIQTWYDNHTHAWAGQADFNLLSSAPNSCQERQEWHLEFITPTTFKVGKHNLPFPLPNLLINSWLRRWNRLGVEPIAEELLSQARDGLAVSAYSLKTVPARNNDRLIIGCVGELTLKPIGLDAQTRRIIEALCKFAFWAGTGQHTTQGFGMTRLKE